MPENDTKAFSDQQAAGYDQLWGKMAPVRDSQLFFISYVFSDLPAEARILCVGAGTGVEISCLAKNRPGWSFTAVDPSGAMLEVCRRRAEEEGFLSRCDFHEGYLETLANVDLYDGATSLLVSQYILEQDIRSKFFHDIGLRLRSGGILANADLALSPGSDNYSKLLSVWLNITGHSDITPERAEELRVEYEKVLSVLPPDHVASIIESAGFKPPVQFFQFGLMHAWFAYRT